MGFFIFSKLNTFKVDWDFGVKIRIFFYAVTIRYNNGFLNNLNFNYPKLQNCEKNHFSELNNSAMRPTKSKQPA